MIPKNERDYWVSRIGKQSAIDMLSYGKRSGNMDSITNMPGEDPRTSYCRCTYIPKKWNMVFLYCKTTLCNNYNMKQLISCCPM